MSNLFDDDNLQPPDQEQEYSDQYVQDQILEEDQQPLEAEEHISDALKRIEQAQLYKTLLTHSLFGPGSARPDIQAAVEREIREFATTRLEILVGIKQDVKAVEAISQFSTDEVNFVKSLFQRAQQRTSSTPQPNPQINPVAAISQPVSTLARPTVNPVQVNQSQPQPRRQAAPSRKVAKTEAKPASKRKGNNVGGFSGKDLGQAGNPKALPMPSATVMAQKAAVEATRNAGSASSMLNPGTSAQSLPGDALGALSSIFMNKNSNSNEED
jgi:hypothetical protein